MLKDTNFGNLYLLKRDLYSLTEICNVLYRDKIVIDLTIGSCNRVHFYLKHYEQEQDYVWSAIAQIRDDDLFITFVLHIAPAEG